MCLTETSIIMKVFDYLAEIWNQDLSNTKHGVGYTHSMRTSVDESTEITHNNAEHAFDVCEIKMSQVRGPYYLESRLQN